MTSTPIIKGTYSNNFQLHLTLITLKIDTSPSSSLSQVDNLQVNSRMNHLCRWLIKYFVKMKPKIKLANVTKKVWTCFISSDDNSQKQPSRDILRKRYSENIQQIYIRIPMPNCDFNKVGKKRAASEQLKS